MGYVQASRAEARIAGDGQKEPDAQDGGCRRHQEDLQKVSTFEVAHETPAKELHFGSQDQLSLVDHIFFSESVDISWRLKSRDLLCASFVSLMALWLKIVAGL
jgi:hypothetical protein